MQQNYVSCQHDDIGAGSFEFQECWCDLHPTYRLHTTDLRRDTKPRERDSCNYSRRCDG